MVEAALLSKKVGKPVKVVWSREDDLHFDYYHSVAAMYMKAATDAKGRPTAWLHRSVFPTIGAMFDPKAEYGQDFEMGMGWIDMPFDLPNHRAENGPAKNHVRIGWLRSVSNIYHAFAVQSFTDELAAAAGRDRVEYMLDLIGSPRIVEIKPEGTMKYEAGQVSAGYGAAAARDRTGGRKIRTGPTRNPATATASASPRIVASPATWRRWWKSKWTKPASCAFRAWTSPSIPG